jgi:glycosyltransferase involved in cell wall biosynthesis
MWHLTQGPAIKGAACTFATAEAEVDDIRRAGLRGPIAVVPHGVDVPQLAQVRTQSIGPRRLVYFGRINWKKGIDYLLRAWREVEATSPDWELRIIGPDNDGYLRMMQELASTLSLKRAYFEGPAYGDEKSHIYRSASLFILPSRTENFGLAVAEALAHGVPAIVTHGAPWSGMTGHGCGWWIPLEHAALVQCLREALSMGPGALAEAGARGRKWMEEDFSWDRVAEVTETTYRWILGGGPRPPWVTERR